MSNAAVINETTQRLINDASSGPGDYVKRFAAAAPARAGKLSAAQQAALSKFDGAVFGFVSKALVYDAPVRWSSVAERRALASLVKGGLLVAEEIAGGCCVLRRSI